MCQSRYAKFHTAKIHEALIVKCQACGIYPPFLIKAAESPSEKLAKELQGKFEKLFMQAENSFAKELASRGVFTLGPRQRLQLVKDILQPTFADMENFLLAFGMDAAELGRLEALGKLEDRGLVFNYTEFNEAQRNAISSHVFEASRRTEDRIIGDVMANLTESYERGLGTDGIARRLKEVFEDLEGYEAERIARTEVIGLSNKGNYETLSEAGVTFKIWLTAQDDRVRGLKEKDKANHVILHGEVRRMDEPFSNGLMYPGDRSGGAPIEEWIQCRCGTGPYFPAEDEIIDVTPYYAFSY